MKKTAKILMTLLISLSIIISVYAADTLVPVGRAAGIKLKSDGAIVVRITDALSPNPATVAGIQKGDVITSVNGEHITSNEKLSEIVSQSEGKGLEITYLRDGKAITTKAFPAKGEDGGYVLGVWIRDSIAGIGTITYYDPETQNFGALGHSISDSETGMIIPVEDGALMGAKVADVKKGEAGNPGELIGEYDLENDFAKIVKNSQCGIFGAVTQKERFEGLEEYPLAKKEEIKRGKATILSNLEGDKVEEYEVEIAGIYFDGEKTKNMLIRATDPRLLLKTGGIVRGMSGSPIIQNGKLVGAVTHVLVNDPTKGYGIFIENMLDAAA